MQTMFLIPVLVLVWVLCIVGSLTIIDEAFDTNIRWDLKKFVTNLWRSDEIT